MQRIGGDDPFVQGRCRLDKVGGNGLFTAGILLLIEDDHGLRCPVRVPCQAQGAEVIADHLSIHRPGYGQFAAMDFQPFVGDLVNSPGSIRAKRKPSELRASFLPVFRQPRGTLP